MIIAGRFNGPPGSGHGGYSAGLFAAAAAAAGPGGPFEVTLRRPPPLDQPLTLVGGEVRAPGGDLVAEVAPVPPFEAVVPPVPYAEAVAASGAYEGFTRHPFPTCYGCGPERADGLRIFPGPLPDGRVAAPFPVKEEATRATVWAALDCAGGWAATSTGEVRVLGRLAADIATVPLDGQACVVMGQAISVQGRKALVHTTLYGPEGELLAQARATWIAI